MRFQGKVGKGLILPTGGEAALLGGQRYRFCPPYPRNLVVVLRDYLKRNFEAPNAVRAEVSKGTNAGLQP
jgi:hypothetical protein